MPTKCPNCDSKKFLTDAIVVRKGDDGFPNAWKNVCIKCNKESIFDSILDEQMTVEKWQQSM